MITMAKHSILHLLLPLFSTILLLTLAKPSKTTSFTRHKPEKLTHFHFYLHDINSGSKPTAVVVATAARTNSSSTSFGVVVIADDLLTEGPDPKSKQIGRAQGLFASVDMKNVSFIMAFNFVFTEGEFSGSTVAMYGRNSIVLKVREMPIIGGTGAFRFARGYAQAKTNKLVGRDAVVEYDVFIWH